jgi:hypothetical protein
LEAYQPQVAIISPSADEVLQDTKVSVQFQVQDLPIFKDSDLGLGPHLHVILDNQPYQAVYDLNEPLVLEDLPPGTHTLRVFASRPWHESFKNEGAYAQTRFHIFTKTTDNNPDPALPLLTYSRPTGSYGAEPIMLDFYLSNAPLHLVAQESPDDEIADWRIRVTINGESFVLDRWQPIYLKGFKPGKNWVQLEFLDEQGNPVKNVFNDTVRLINYEPKGKDTLSKLVRNELSPEATRSIVVPNYKVETPPTLSPVVTPTSSPSPTVTPEPIPSVAPSIEETPTPELATPEEEPTPPVESAEPATPEEEPTPPAESAPTEAKQTEKPKSGGIFSRFRRPAEAPSKLEAPLETPIVVPEEAQPTPELEVSPTLSEPPASVEESPPVEEVIPPESVDELTPAEEAAPTQPLEPEQPKPGGIGGFFNSIFSRFQGSTEGPSPSPQLPEELDAPSETLVVPEEPKQTPEPEASVTPTEPSASINETTTTAEPVKPEAEPTPQVQLVPLKPIQPESPEADLSEPATLPEIVPTPKPAVSPSGKPETPNPESAAKPKLDLKELLLSPPAPNPSPRIIQAPTAAESDIPSRYLKKSAPDAPTNVPEASQTLDAD